MPGGRVELPSLSARDFESRMVTNFITRAFQHYTYFFHNSQFLFGQETMLKLRYANRIAITALFKYDFLDQHRENQTEPLPAEAGI